LIVLAGITADRFAKPVPRHEGQFLHQHAVAHFIEHEDRIELADCG
jgi:hypothetical protein